MFIFLQVVFYMFYHELYCGYILIMSSLYYHILHIFVKQLLLCAFDMQE